jgi:anti-sigma regulatory factor (Ser/Thr protein kinase)
LNTANGADHGITMSAGPTRFSCQLLADPARLRPVRHAVARWAADAGLAAGRVEDLTLAVGEAMSNSIEHAYRAEPGPIEIDCRIVDSTLNVEVHDHGNWREPLADPGWRGRGISMIIALADRAEVIRREAGTTVTMCWRLDD